MTRVYFPEEAAGGGGGGGDDERKIGERIKIDNCIHARRDDLRGHLRWYEHAKK